MIIMGAGHSCLCAAGIGVTVCVRVCSLCRSVIRVRVAMQE